jgi:hypothetical protein
MIGITCFLILFYSLSYVCADCSAMSEQNECESSVGTHSDGSGCQCAWLDTTTTATTTIGDTTSEMTSTLNVVEPTSTVIDSTR